MASSSTANYGYDVFLSFRGTDTRNNFTSHLHKALCDKNIKAFIDNSIERGEEITSFLEGIIEGAKLSIIVFSSDYASSTYCLNEMVKIIKCKETKAQIVLPIFYKVYPSEEIYKEAFARHEQTIKQETIVGKLMSFFLKALYWATFCLTFTRYEEIISKEMKVERWKSSFQKALELAGWHIDDNRNEATVIEEITTDVLKRLNCPFEGKMKSTQIVGRTSEDYLEKIMELLMNDENPKVGVWGMGGVGKTTIITHINNRLLNDASFSRHIYWVTVSKESSIYKLQGDIAKEIKLDLSREDNESKRVVKLFNELKRINKFVLILDDVWEPFETEDVGIPLMGEGKLLLTTRYLGVCQRMTCQPIEVKPLSELEALEFFMEESRSPINDSQLVMSIVKECAGLPLAIVVVARTMRGVKETWKWRNILRELQKPCEGENPEIDEKVFKVLKFSYDRLSNDRCRQCFLYCSLFPEDHQFERDELIEYLIAVGLIDEQDCSQAELDKGNVILDELIHASLLEFIVHLRKIKMHDVIKDMARMNLKVGLKFEDLFESVQVLKSFPYSPPHCSKLKTLLLRGNDMEELPGCFFGNMQSLNVLKIENVKSIPASITNLRNLRVLIINYCCNLECISSLAGLENLRYLNISKNELKEIPTGIERLVKLRVLDISDNRPFRRLFPIGVVKKLSDLRTLNLIGTRVELEAEALINLEKLQVLKVQFDNLQKLNCYVRSGHWRRLLEYEIHYGEGKIHNWEKGTCLKIISMKAINGVEEWKEEFGMFLPDDIQCLKLVGWESPIFHYFNYPDLANLQTITISRCKSRYLFTVDLAKHLLHSVQHLRIEICNKLEEIIESEEEWVKLRLSNYPTILLPNLKMLELSNLPALRSIYRGKLVCPSLESIDIDMCNNLKRLPFYKEKVGNKSNPSIKLGGMILSSWWESLQWDDPNTKSMYLPSFTSDELQVMIWECMAYAENVGLIPVASNSIFDFDGKFELGFEG